MSNLKQNGQLRWAPSYLRNRGKMTRAQKRAMREWWPTYGLRFEHAAKIDLDGAFPGTGPLLIEIGFGRGDHLISLAHQRPDCRILGIEVHRPGLAAALLKIREASCENVRLIRGDARLVLTDHLLPHIADAVFVQFPDPWPKPGDAHRRLIQPGMLEVVHRCLRPGGELLIATDVADYARHCIHTLEQADGWRERSDSPWQAYRVDTPYEQKGLEEGRSIAEIVYQTYT